MRAPRLIHLDQQEQRFDELNNHTRERIHINRLIIAYKRPLNLKNLLFPRHVESKCASAISVSNCLENLPANDPNENSDDA